ncbi:MAG: hypothetical protein JNK87_37715 [Bryobacterales bacterium]|nr:hypothetical protein [Bryobacterales bacterium]
MMRWVYHFLIRLHPNPFRARHGREMEEIFEDSDPGTRGWLLRDAAVSLVRQWTLREQEESTPAPVEGGPVFQLVGADRPDAKAVVHGSLVTIALWLTLAGLMTYGAAKRLSPRSLNGSSRGNPQVAGAYAPGERTAPGAPARFFGDTLFDALDANGDGVLSNGEANLARLLLHTLDRNRDGVVTAGECGIRLPMLQRWLGGAAVFQIIDRNGDQVIEEIEEWASPSLLRAADADRDGRLTPEEVRGYRR